MVAFMENIMYNIGKKISRRMMRFGSSKRYTNQGLHEFNNWQGSRHRGQQGQEEDRGKERRYRRNLPFFLYLADGR